MASPSQENVTILIDVQNLYHSSLTFGGAKISYKKLIDKIGENRNILFSAAYAAHRDGNAAKKFYIALEKLGVRVVSKRVQVKKLGNTAKSKVIPVHFDTEIAVDAMRYPEETNTVILCTGNGNFEYLVDALVEEGLKVEVWSFKESTSERLIKRAKFVQIPQDCLLTKEGEDVVDVVEEVKE